MIKVLYFEMKKFFVNKVIIVSLIILTLIMALTIYLGSMAKFSTVFDLQFYVLINFNDYFVTAFFIALTSYIYTLEIDYKTIKILKMKEISIFKVYISKFIVAALYMLFVYLIIYILPFFNTSKFAIHTMSLKISGVPTNNVIESFSAVTSLYVQQFIASLFCIAFVMLLTICTFNKAIPIVGSILFNLFSSTYSGINIPIIRGIGSVLPINADNIYREYAYSNTGNKLIVIVVYTIILIVISTLVYRKKEVRV